MYERANNPKHCQLATTDNYIKAITCKDQGVTSVLKLNTCLWVQVSTFIQGGREQIMGNKSNYITRTYSFYSRTKVDKNDSAQLNMYFIAKG